MSGKLLSYSGITTKVKAMEKSLIQKDDYNTIAYLESVPEFITFLKKQDAYMNMFANQDEHTLHRGKIERIITNAVHKEYAKIYRFSNMHQRSILRLIFFRYEVNVLKGCLHRVFNQDISYDLGTFQEFFQTHSTLNVDALVSAKSLDEFIVPLKGTEYYPLFRTMMNSNHQTPFDYEMQLDVYYFKKVWKLKNKLLKGAELESFTECIGKQIDLQNIMWIYRSKKYYTVDSSKILSIIIPVNYKLTKIQLTNLMDSTTLDEFLAALNATYYNTILASLEQYSIERIYQKAMLKVYKDNSLKNPLSIAPILLFLFLKELEIDKLTTALECIRYNLGPNVILKYVM